MLKIKKEAVRIITVGGVPTQVTDSYRFSATLDRARMAVIGHLEPGTEDKSGFVPSSDQEVVNVEVDLPQASVKVRGSSRAIDPALIASIVAAIGQVQSLCEQAILVGAPEDLQLDSVA